jgi:hypothetical protein
MPSFAAQFLEYFNPGLHTPAAIRERLQQAFERLPLEILIIGWNLPPEIISACAEETARHNAKLYRWHPLLSGDGHFVPRPEWKTIGASGKPVNGFKGLDEFTFVCPNKPEVRETVFEHLRQALTGTRYDGLFLDRIRYPSPAADPLNELACFCPDCIRMAGSAGLDLESVQRKILRLAQAPAGRVELVKQLFTPGAELAGFMDFRQRTISALVQSAADLARANGCAIGLDTFSPALTQMVGQDLSALDAACDWIKPMSYAHTLGPAGLPYELLGLAGWLVAGGAPEAEAMACLAAASGLELPSSWSALREAGLPPSALEYEMKTAKRQRVRKVLAGIALVELENVNRVPSELFPSELSAYRAGGADGLVLAWDLWHIPLERLEQIAQFW